jgi:hypothetical protein
LEERVGKMAALQKWTIERHLAFNGGKFTFKGGRYMRLISDLTLESWDMIWIDSVKDSMH